jgi:hypothetical protein
MATTTRTGRLRHVLTPYRAICTVALVAATLLVIFGFQGAHDDRATGCAIGPIVQLIPCPGDRGLSQGIIGAVLTTDFKAAIVVDRTEIPEDQMRTAGANQIYFQPGPGTETGSLTPGDHSATLIYWPATGTRERDAKSFSWSFGVT